MDELNQESFEELREKLNTNPTEPKTHKPDFDEEPDEAGARESGLERAREIESRLEQRELEVPDDANIVGDIVHEMEDGNTPFDYEMDAVEPDMRVVNGIKRTFKKIKARAQSTTDVEGYEIDFDNLIQRRAGNKNIRRVFRAEKTKVGLNVTILIDVSASMGINDRIVPAKKAVLNLWEALDGLQEVDVDVYAYSGREDDDYKTPIWELTKDKLKIMWPMGNTHTHRALQYIGNKLSKKTGKKLVLLVTDGLPEGGGSRDWDAKELTGYIVSKLRKKKGIMLYSVFIGEANSQTAPAVSDEELMTMFGSEETFTKVDDYSNLFNALIKGVGRKVINLFY